MKLILTALIDFNNSQKLDQNASDKFKTNDKVLKLIQPNTLLDKIAEVNGDAKPNISDFYQNLSHATLRFSDASFRKHYIDWIYSNYSHSMINQRRVRSIEREVVVNWAKQFNQHHTHLKIVKLAPKINDDSFHAKLWIIGYGRRLNRNSFDFQNALDLEYHQDYRLSFYNFELDESRRLAANFDKTFNTYMPNADFHFFNEAPSYAVVNHCQPLRFNPDWLEAHQKQSASAVRSRIKKAHLAYSSVSSRANSLADQTSKVVSSFKAQASSALSNYSSASAKLSEQTAANASLRSSFNSLSSATANSNQTVTSYKKSRDRLQNQVNGLKKNRHVTESKSAAHQIKSLKARNSSLTSIFDYNQSVYKSQLSEVTSSADAIKLQQASSVSKPTSKQRNNDSLRQRNADLEQQISSQSAELSKQDNQSANQNVTKSVPSEKAGQEQKAVKKAKPSRKAIYIPMIIVISIIIVILLIFVFPLFRF